MIVKIVYDKQLHMSKNRIAQQVAEAVFGLRFKGRPMGVVVQDSTKLRMDKQLDNLIQCGYKYYVQVDTTGGKLTRTAIAWVDESVSEWRKNKR